MSFDCDAVARSSRTSPAFAAAQDGLELKAWRLFGAEIAPQLERILAAQGDNPDAEILKLQHALAELRTGGWPTDFA